MSTVVSFCVLSALWFKGLSFAQVPGYDVEVITTPTMTATLTNIGTLERFTVLPRGLRWLDGDYDVVYAHGLWVTGLMGDSLVGTSSSWLTDYSPGPIINGQAAMVIHPEDSTKYRVYHIDRSSGPGGPDYDGWPVQWGAPHYPDGTPLVYGNQTTYMVYNDGHPGEGYNGLPPTGPTPLEIHETVWDYGTTNGLENVIFFRYQVYNRGAEDIRETALALWTDIDLTEHNWNWGGYNPNGNYMFIYYYDDSYPGFFPRACTYVLLQGPMVPAPGYTAMSFGKEIPDVRNLATTSGYYVYASGAGPAPVPFWPIFPYNLVQLRNASLGLWLDGQPIVHPITGDTTTYMYDGDPVTGEGWLWQRGHYGGAGFISSSSTFDLLAGDSTEAVFALVVVPSDSFGTALTELEKQVIWLKEWWAENELSIREEIEPQVPREFELLEIYPNPFNPSTTIRWLVNSPGNMELSVFNVAGQYLETIFYGYCAPGLNQVTWTGGGYSSGVYVIYLKGQNTGMTEKVVLIK